MIEIRDKRGRFAKGTRGGPGRLPKSREEKYRSIFTETIGPEKFRACCYQIWLDSVGKKLDKNGKLANDPQSTPYTRTNAFGRIAAYAIGKPIQPVLIDSAEGELLEVFREMSDESLDDIISEAKKVLERGEVESA